MGTCSRSVFLKGEKKKSRTFGKDSQDNSIMPFHVFPKSSKSLHLSVGQDIPPTPF